MYIVVYQVPTTPKQIPCNCKTNLADLDSDHQGLVEIKVLQSNDDDVHGSKARSRTPDCKGASSRPRFQLHPSSATN